MSQVFGAAALVAAAVAVAAVGVVVAARWSTPARRVVTFVAPAAPWAAVAVASAMVAGSLYLSEVAGFIPCELCWYQRICAYPLVVVGVVGLVRRDRGAWTYAVPLAVVGLVIAGYHHLIQAFPNLSEGTCAPTAPCTDRHVWLWGFMSVPAMAAAGFAAVLAAALFASTARRLRNRDATGPSVA